MKQAEFQCMFFSSLRLEWQQKQDAELNAIDGISLGRNDESCIAVKYHKRKTATYKMLLIWMFGFIVALSTVKAGDDLEVRLKGDKAMQLNLADKKIKAGKDIELTFLFKTIHPTALLLWATGKTGDNILVELVRGKLRIVLGSEKNFTASNYEQILLEDNLCDNQWHQVNIKILQDTTYAKVDIADPFISRTKQRRSFDDMITVGGLPKNHPNLPSSSNRNYAGCFSYVVLNNVDILSELHKQNSHSEWTCKESENFDVINFDREETYVQFVNPIVFAIDMGLQFRTYYRDGVLMTNEIDNQSTVKQALDNIMGFTLYFEDNVVKLRVQSSTVITIRPNVDIDFGSWCNVHLNLKKELATLTVGAVTKTASLKKTSNNVNFGKSVLLGKRRPVASVFRGWMWNISMNDQRLSYLNATVVSAVSIGICKMDDFCYPNPCYNGGRCIQTNNGSRCNCSGTGYDGVTCLLRSKQYKRTCNEYYLSGLRESGWYMIIPGSTLFRVYCKMDDVKGPVTVITHRHGGQFRAVYETASSDKDFYYHNIEYNIEKREIDNIAKVSRNCRQYIEYSCSSSTLMFSNDKENALVNRYGARWFSKDGRIQNYWGGGTKESFNCACGRAGNCVDPNLKCNCDSMHKEWRSDGGYLNDKLDLPVSKIQFSKKYTNPSAMYKLGPLQCFGGPIKTTKAPEQTTTDNKLLSDLPLSLISSIGAYQNTGTTISTKGNSRKTVSQGKETRKSAPAGTKKALAHSKAPKSTLALQTDTRGFLQKNGSSKNSTYSKTFAQNGEKLPATEFSNAVRSTARNLLIDRSAEQPESAMSNKQTLILIALISSLALLTIILIFAVVRQRLLRPNKKLTIELKEDPENGSSYALKQSSNNSRSPAQESGRYLSTPDVNKIEIIKVTSPFRKKTASESGSSVSSFDTSRYLEVGDESDSGSTSSFTKTKGILKSKNQFIMCSRPRSEDDQYDVDDPGEIIALIHVNDKESRLRSDEQTSLLTDNKADGNSYVKFHLHPENVKNATIQTRNDGSRFSYSDRESIDADAGFITDSSSSCDSRKSLSSSGSEESNDESYSKKHSRPKRCVRFSIQEFTPNTSRKADDDMYGNSTEGEDEVFT